MDREASWGNIRRLLSDPTAEILTLVISPDQFRVSRTQRIIGHCERPLRERLAPHALTRATVVYDSLGVPTHVVFLGKVRLSRFIVCVC
jgi:hypothetical protein